MKNTIQEITNCFLIYSSFGLEKFKDKKNV